MTPPALATPPPGPYRRRAGATADPERREGQTHPGEQPPIGPPSVVVSAWRPHTEASVREVVRVLPLSTQPKLHSYADRVRLSNDPKPARKTPGSATSRARESWVGSGGLKDPR